MNAASYVLVGYDGLPASEHALRWAVREARLRRLGLRVVHAWYWPYPAEYDDYQVRAIVRRTGEHVLDRGVALARRMAPEVRVRKRLMDGPPHAALMSEGHDAELIVVGSHEKGVLPVGSTASWLPARAHRPVVAVRTSGFEHAVVCVDGAAGGERALAFAFEQAALRGWRLDAVCGSRDPDSVQDRGPFDDDEFRWGAARLERAVRPWLEKYRVNVRLAVLPKTPREAMLEAAASAGLVVVGHRGATGPDPLGLTATSGALLRNAPCTVAVVRAE
ncbi:universal stress protein [Actinomadura sp. 9N407]|uniref:universal stress protein n=1 Tax=Actinomadura sp. 9N407 TaxID=3375154 RepID=UPI0037922EC1